MMRYLSGCLMMLFLALSSHAAVMGKGVDCRLKGHVVEKGKKESLGFAVIQLLALPDSSLIAGTTSAENGNFAFRAPLARNQVLKVSFMGYQPKVIPIGKPQGNATEMDLGTIELVPSHIMLKGVDVVAKAAKMQMNGDTLVFNSAAYKTSEGAKMVELVRQLPGVQIDDDGTVKIHGKTLKKIMVEGKEFFGGDVKTGLQNIPVGMVEKLKSYEKKSDLTRLTGVDDGEEEVVLDVKVKKGMNNGTFGELTAGMGNKGRYSTQVTLNRFDNQNQYSLIGGVNNVNDRNYSNTQGMGFSPRGSGLQTGRNVGVNISRSYKKGELQANVRYDNSNEHMENKMYSEHFLKTSRSFANSLGSNRSKPENLYADLRWEWKMDSLTTLFVVPRINVNKNRTESLTSSMTFEQDPYQKVENPYDYVAMEEEGNPLRGIALNGMRSEGKSRNSGYGFTMYSYLNRRLSRRGRNVTIGFNAGVNDNEAQSMNRSDTHYYRLHDREGNDSVLSRNRYLNSPANGGYYGLRLTYNEPLVRNLFLQLDYRYKHSYSKSTRQVYDLPQERWDKAWPGDEVEEYRADSLSKDAKYVYNDHDVVLGVKWVTKLLQLTMGAGVKPQFTKLSYRRGGYEVDTTRSVVNFSPRFDLRLNFSKTFRMMMRYRGRSSVPSIENLLPVADNLNPLFVRVGNPGLKPTFVHSAMMFLNAYRPKTQQGLMMHVFFNAYRNQVSTSVRYNEQTGGQISMPVNVNGSWSLSSMLGGNTPLFGKLLNLNANVNWGYDRNVSLLYDRARRTEGKNISTRLYLDNRSNLSYRNDWMEVGISALVRMSSEKNKMRAEQNYKPLDVGVGMNATFQMPWKMSAASNINRLTRSGYADDAMNKSEWIWNLQLAQTFLKGALTARIEVFDVLGQMSNITRNFEATKRSISEMNGYNSYMMFSISYNINQFGKRQMTTPPMQRQRGRGHGRFGGFGRGR